MHYYYVIYDEVALNLIPAQITPLFRLLSANGYNAHCVGFVSLRTFFHPAWRRMVKDRYFDLIGNSDEPIIFLPKLPLFLCALMLALLTAKKSGVVLHCRGPIATHIALLVRGLLRKALKIVYDARGASPEEWEYTDGYGKRFYRLWIRRLIKFERDGLVKADAALFVTERLKAHMTEKYAVVPEHTGIFPCYVDDKKLDFSLSHKARIVIPKLNEKKSFVMLYSGSFAKWQMPRETFKLFRRVVEKRPEAFLLVLSPHLKSFHGMAQEEGVKDSDYSILSGNREDMLQLYKLAHLGVLIREESTLNDVAFPVKFGEYLYMGLPVVVSKAITTCVQLVEQNKLGIVTDTNTENWIDSLANDIVRFMDSSDGDAIRNRCQNFARQELSFQRYSDQYLEFFSKLTSGGKEQ